MFSTVLECDSVLTCLLLACSQAMSLRSTAFV